MLLNSFEFLAFFHTGVLPYRLLCHHLLLLLVASHGFNILWRSAESLLTPGVSSDTAFIYNQF